MQRKLLCKVSFLGTAYLGFQCQKNGRTIQEQLSRAAEALFGYPCDITGCSRTDSGVHANMFCLTISKKGENVLPTAIPTERIPLALCAHLPEDIAVYEAVWVDASFHPRYDVVYKEYQYLIWNHAVRGPFAEGRAYHFPHPIDQAGLLNMNRACTYLLGSHDFAAFMAKGSRVNSTVRCIMSADVRVQDKMLVFTVSADGFLYNMVRIMAGTLLDVAVGHITPEDILQILEKKDRSLAGPTLPACGLYLNRVVYPEHLLLLSENHH